MSPLDPSLLVREVLAKASAILDTLPDPFDEASLRAADPKLALPARLRGKLAQLREMEKEIHRRYVWDTGALVQKHISLHMLASTLFFREDRALFLSEQKNLSEVREGWIRDLSIEERTVFERICWTVAEDVLPLFLPPKLSPDLQGAVARLALEAGAVHRRHSARRSEVEKEMRHRNLNHAFIADFLIKEDHLSIDAFERLVARWSRELTPEQEAALDGRQLASLTGPNTHPNASTQQGLPKGRPGRPTAYTEAYSLVKEMKVQNTWEKMWEACKERGFDLPDNVETFKRTMQAKLNRDRKSNE